MSHDLTDAVSKFSRGFRISIQQYNSQVKTCDDG